MRGVAGDLRRRDVASSFSAPAFTQESLSQFGYSNGTISDMAPSDMAMYLNAIKEVTGPGGIVRAPLHWDPYQTAGPSWTKYDAFIAGSSRAGWSGCRRSTSHTTTTT